MPEEGEEEGGGGEKEEEENSLQRSLAISANARACSSCGISISASVGCPRGLEASMYLKRLVFVLGAGKGSTVYPSVPLTMHAQQFIIYCLRCLPGEIGGHFVFLRKHGFHQLRRMPEERFEFTFPTVQRQKLVARPLSKSSSWGIQYSHS